MKTKLSSLELEIDRMIFCGWFSTPSIFEMYDGNVVAQQYILENHMDEELEFYLNN